MFDFAKIKKTDTDVVDAKELSADKLEVIQLINEVSEFVYNVIDECADPQRAFFLAVQASEFTDRARDLIIKLEQHNAR